MALEFSGTFSVQNVFGMELIMISLDISLIIIFIGAFILMAGILFFKEPRKNMRSTLGECVAWGLGFFISMSVQVAIIATMS